jgi:hypothetical protein
MQLVIHTCGQQLYRHEAGGVARTVRYGRLSDQREINECPSCGENLSDSTLKDAQGQPIKEDSPDPGRSV